MAFKAPPYQYEHPGRTGEAKPVDTSNPDKPKLEPRSVTSPISMHSTSAANASLVRIPITFPVPVRGQSAPFDAMIDAGVDARRAALKIANDAWLAFIPIAHDIDLRESPNGVMFSATSHETSRRLPAATLAHMKQTMDPFGLESARNFGRLVGTVALALWIQRSTKVVS